VAFAAGRFCFWLYRFRLDGILLAFTTIPASTVIALAFDACARIAEAGVAVALPALAVAERAVEVLIHAIPEFRGHFVGSGQCKRTDDHAQD
jgi:hypothetical protein